MLPPFWSTIRNVQVVMNEEKCEIRGGVELASERPGTSVGRFEAVLKSPALLRKCTTAQANSKTVNPTNAGDNSEYPLWYQTTVRRLEGKIATENSIKLTKSYVSRQNLTYYRKCRIKLTVLLAANSTLCPNMRQKTLILLPNIDSLQEIRIA